jgi:type III pantothenate kinase
MLLAIDARNRSIYLGFRSGEKWLARKRIAASSPARSADEYALLMSAFAREITGVAEGVSSVIDTAWMSSVVPSLTRNLRDAVESAFGVPCSVVGPGVRTGVRLRTDIPSEVGSDLVCAAVAAADIAARAAVVVHFDAAIAFSALGKTGDFLGAAIAPGFYTGIESLRSSAALLPEVALAQSFAGDIGAAIGKSTAQSVRAGIFLGYAGLVERIVRTQIDELVASGEAGAPGDVAILGSGGEEGRAIFSELRVGQFVPDLVLEGIARIASRAEHG